MVELNTSYILNARTESAFYRAIEEVHAMTPPSGDVNYDGPESTSLWSAFERQIQRLLRTAKASLQDARDVIAFVRDANRPLRLHELLYLFALRFSNKEFDDMALRHPQDLMQITQGLIKSGADDLVDYIHPSLRLYLERDISCRHEFPNAHQRLAELSIKYLTWPRFSLGPYNSAREIKHAIDQAPFWIYAVGSLHRHYTLASREEEQPGLRLSIQAFLSRQGSLACAQQLIRFVGTKVIDRQQTRERIQGDTEDVRPAFVSDNSIVKWLDCHELYWQDCQKTTSLHLAILLQLDDFALELLDDCDPASVNATNDLNETPLHLAIVHSGKALIRRLISKGADLNACDRRGMSPWHVAAACGNAFATGMLRQIDGQLQFNARVQSTTSRWSNHTNGTSELSPKTISTWYNRAISGSTALHLAARNGHLEVVKQLSADSRFDWSIEDDDGMTAFHKACKYGRLDIVRHLVAQTPRCSEYQSGKDGRTGLHVACKYQSGFEVATYLVQCQPELCSITDNRDETALHHAASGLDSRAVKLLLDQRLVDVNARNCQGQTPIMLAVFNPNDGFEMLLQHKALERDVQVGLLSISELAKKRAAIAHPPSKTTFTGSSLHSRAVKLKHLAESLSEDSMRSLTPDIH